MKKKVLVGFLGVQVDIEGWKPTISLLKDPSLSIDRFELLYNDSSHEHLAQSLKHEIVNISPKTEVCLRLIDLSDPWDFESVYHKLLDFTDQYSFSNNEEYLINTTTGTHVIQICLFLLTESRRIPGKLIQVVPRNLNDAPNRHKSFRIIDLELDRYNSISKRFAIEVSKGVSFLKDGIKTKNDYYNDLIKEIGEISIKSKEPILLGGSTGVGKTKLAKRIYELKRENKTITDDVFVHVNCSSLRGELVMSALFGHKKGAFTGANDNRNGFISEANNGVLFLDEIGDLPAQAQADLLIALEEKRFRPVGGSKDESSNFQLIAGTNQNLNEAARSGKFRQDLLARIDLWSFVIPDLKDRKEDIEPNLDYELRLHEKETGKHIRFDRIAKKRYLDFALSDVGIWLDNFRDLHKSVIRMCTFSKGEFIELDTVINEIKKLSESWGNINISKDYDKLDEIINENDISALNLFERTQLSNVINVCLQSVNLKEAAQALYGNKSNPSDYLNKYLKRYHIRSSMIFSEKNK
jgi:transcriptional regulatory protein RtcR